MFLMLLSWSMADIGSVSARMIINGQSNSKAEQSWPNNGGAQLATIPDCEALRVIWAKLIG